MTTAAEKKKETQNGVRLRESGERAKARATQVMERQVAWTRGTEDALSSISPYRCTASRISGSCGTVSALPDREQVEEEEQSPHALRVGRIFARNEHGGLEEAAPAARGKLLHRLEEYAWLDVQHSLSAPVVSSHARRRTEAAHTWQSAW